MIARRPAIVATALALALSACAPETGTVTSSTAAYNSLTKRWTYQVCVRADNGKRGCTPAVLNDYLNCEKGDHWPDMDAIAATA